MSFVKPGHPYPGLLDIQVIQQVTPETRKPDVIGAICSCIFFIVLC